MKEIMIEISGDKKSGKTKLVKIIAEVLKDFKESSVSIIDDGKITFKTNS